MNFRRDSRKMSVALGRKNSFDFIRLVAAFFVVLSHSYATTGNPEPGFGNIHLGTIGVWVFFILSGYLIAASWDQYPRFNVFFAKRALRIFPGLAVAVLLTIIVCGLFFTTMTFSDYLSARPSLWYLNNIFLYNTQMRIAGVFETNIYPDIINGSIWTLAYEFTMYIVVALIGVFKVYRKLSALKIWLGLFTLHISMTLIGSQYFETFIFYLRFDKMIPLALLFFSGIVVYKEAKRIKFTYPLGIAALALFIMLSFLYPIISTLLAPVLLAYALFALGRSPVFSGLGKYGDFSYGLYIYSFPIQQMLFSITETRSELKMFMASSFISFLLAYLSWHLVESRALKLKSKINTDKYPLAQSDNAW